MADDALWFEEQLGIPEQISDFRVKEMLRLDLNNRAALEAGRADAQGLVRVHVPRLKRLDAVDDILSSGELASHYLLRFALEFVVPEAARDRGTQFVRGSFASELSSSKHGEPQPRVYDVIPKNHYEGSPEKINLKFSPALKFDKFEASLGQVNTDLTVGMVEPSVVGYAGLDERSPSWELRPNTNVLLGLRHLWLILEVPRGCSAIRISASASGDVRTRYLKLIPIAPKIPVAPQTRVIDLPL